MNRSETLFIDGVPVGKIVQNEFEGTLAFIPREGYQRLPAKAWRDVDELKRAVHKANKDESPRLNSWAS